MLPLEIVQICLAMIDDESDRIKFEQLYHEYEGLVLYRAKQLLSDFQLAEDAASLTFIDIAKNMKMVDQVKSPRTKALLMLVVEHKAIDLARKQKRDLSDCTDFSELEQRVAPERADYIVENMLDEALERLPWPYRQAILLRYANGYETREIATLLNYTVSKVEKLLSRGKQQLRQILKEMQS